METKNFKPIVWTATVVVVAIIGIGIYLITQKADQLKQLELKNQALSETISHRDSVVNDFADTFNQIEERLTFIKTKRAQLSLAASQEGNFNRKQAMLNDIEMMDSMLVASSKHIEQLEKKLKDSGIRMRSFENRIALLNKTIEENSAEIAQLRTSLEEKEVQIAGLNTRVEEMNSELLAKEEAIRQHEGLLLEKDVKMNTAWYTSGTFRELKDKGILQRDGGFLGLGTSKVIRDNLKPADFVELDIRESRSIPLHAKKVNVISEHPDSSYQLVYADGLVSELVIQDPEEFWKISKFAVIEVK